MWKCHFSLSFTVFYDDHGTWQYIDANIPGVCWPGKQEFLYLSCSSLNVDFVETCVIAC